MFLCDIVVTLDVEGFHNWPEAKELLPDAAFLSDRHRHIFKVKIWKHVTHDDRDVEIILFKRKVLKFLNKKYGTPCEFGRKSCEELAREICFEFECSAVEVLEDGENGAVITNTYPTK